MKLSKIAYNNTHRGTLLSYNSIGTFFFTISEESLQYCLNKNKNKGTVLWFTFDKIMGTVLLTQFHFTIYSFTVYRLRFTVYGDSFLSHFP